MCNETQACGRRTPGSLLGADGSHVSKHYTDSLWRVDTTHEDRRHGPMYPNICGVSSNSFSQ